ncbi:Olfactory receptor 6K6, partial [Ophiophagus hannah]
MPALGKNEHHQIFCMVSTIPKVLSNLLSERKLNSLHASYKPISSNLQKATSSLPWQFLAMCSSLNYPTFMSNKISTQLTVGSALAVIYAVLTPFFNPIIHSLDGDNLEAKRVGFLAINFFCLSQVCKLFAGHATSAHLPKLFPSANAEV